MLLCVTHMLCVSQVCHGVSRCEKMRIVLRQAWGKSMQYLSEKMQFSGFLFPQVVQKYKLGEVGK